MRAAALDVRDEPRHRTGCNRGRGQQAQRVRRLALAKVVRAAVVVLPDVPEKSLKLKFSVKMSGLSV